MPGKIAAVLALSAVFGSVQVAAKPTFVSKIPNGANVDGVEALGHVDPSGGGSRNDFGTAFDSAGFTWTKELCEADSDGDGQTNGQELGDPCCAWVEGTNEKVEWSTGLSHPGLATSKSDASLWASVKCGAASSATSSTTGSSASSSTTTTPAPATTTATPSATTSAVATTPAATTAAPSSAASTASFALASAAAVAVAAVFA